MSDLSARVLDRLLLELLDDAISADDHRRLQDTLLTSKPARDRYLELAALHNFLELRAAAPMVVTIPRQLSVKGPDNRPLPRRPFFAKARPLVPRRSSGDMRAVPIMRRATYRFIRKSVRNIPSLATVAVLALGAVFLSLRMISAPPAARVASSPGSIFTISHPKTLKRAPKENTLAPGSSIELTQGTVELTLSSGVRGVFQAPETITLTDDLHLALNRGASWFHVPPKAVGFEVITPHLKIVDLGTEFGVVARPDGPDEIHVLAGRVEVTARQGSQSGETLLAGDSCIATADGRLTKIKTKPDLFLTKLPDSLPYLHWSFDDGDPNRLTTDGSHPAAGHIVSQPLPSTGAPVFAGIPGKFGQALSSPGRNGYVETDWQGVEGSSPRTIAYWIKLPPGRNYIHPIVGWGARDSYRSFFSYVKSIDRGTVAAVSFDTFWLEGSIPIDDGRWHHLAAAYTGRSLPNGDPETYCYVDGVQDSLTRHELNGGAPRDARGNIIATTACSGPDSIPLTFFTDMYSDRKMPARAISPAIDELYIFGAALSHQQILNLVRFNRHDGPATPPVERERK